MEEDDDQLDRISGILSNLIQEANEAVNYNESESITSIPLVRKLSSSSSGTSDIQPTRIHRSNSAYKQPILYPSASFSTPRRRSSATTTTNTSIMTTVRKNRIMRSGGNDLLESFKRLDSSMAMIDSLSRDLVPEEQITTASVTTFATPSIKKKSSKNRLTMKPTFDARLSALILLPLLHVPHALISMVFDTMSSAHTHQTHDSSSSSSTLGGMVVWAFIFAITNLVVDKAVIIKSDKEASDTISSATTTTSITNHRRFQSNNKKVLPGAFSMDRALSKSNPGSSSNSKRRPSSTNSNNMNRKLYKRRTSQQQQKQRSKSQQETANIMQHDSTFNLFKRKTFLLRRNSL